MRRGMTPAALKRFMLEQGPSKNTNLMEWDKIWAYNKAAIDPVAPRYTAIVRDTSAMLILDNGPAGLCTEAHPLHQKNPDMGTKAVVYGKEALIEAGDAVDIEVGEKITLMKWGNAVVTKKDTDAKGKIIMIADLKLNDKDFKGTKKLTWVAVDPQSNFDVTLVELGHLITKDKIEEEDKVEDLVNENSYIPYTAIAEGNMKNLKKGDIIQLERRGYFFVDKLASDKENMTLHFIPDGKSKNMSAIESKIDAAKMAKGAGKPPKEEKKVEPAGADGKLSKK